MGFNPFENLQSTSKDVFSYLQKQGSKTKHEIMEKTEMKLTTLNRMMKPLEELGLIEEVGTKKSTGGRKPSVYGVSSHSYFVLGIDISRTYVEIIISDLRIKIINKSRFDLDSSFTPERTVTWIGQQVIKMLEDSNIKRKQVIGAGLGTVGPMDKDEGILISPMNFPGLGWENINIKPLLERELKIPVLVDNGANAALFGENNFGIGKGISSVLYFNCGVGIRTAAAVSNKLIRGHLNKEDMFAHMVVDMNGERCVCGNRGCIECYSTIIAIVNKFKDEMKKDRYTIIKKSIDEVDYKDICQAANNGDVLSQEIIEKAARIFGTGLQNYINILNPEMVILSGPLIQNSDYFYEICVETVNMNNGINNQSVIFNKQGKLKQHAISVGAAALYVEELMGTGKN